MTINVVKEKIQAKDAQIANLKAGIDNLSPRLEACAATEIGLRKEIRDLKAQIVRKDEELANENRKRLETIRQLQEKTAECSCLDGLLKELNSVASGYNHIKRLLYEYNDCSPSTEDFDAMQVNSVEIVNKSLEEAYKEFSKALFAKVEAGRHALDKKITELEEEKEYISKNSAAGKGKEAKLKQNQEEQKELKTKLKDLYDFRIKRLEQLEDDGMTVRSDAKTEHSLHEEMGEDEDKLDPLDGANFSKNKKK